MNARDNEKEVQKFLQTLPKEVRGHLNAYSIESQVRNITYNLDKAAQEAGKELARNQESAAASLYELSTTAAQYGYGVQYSVSPRGDAIDIKFVPLTGADSTNTFATKMNLGDSQYGMPSARRVRVTDGEDGGIAFSNQGLVEVRNLIASLKKRTRTPITNNERVRNAVRNANRTRQSNIAAGYGVNRSGPGAQYDAEDFKRAYTSPGRVHTLHHQLDMNDAIQGFIARNQSIITKWMKTPKYEKMSQNVLETELGDVVMRYIILQQNWGASEAKKYGKKLGLDDSDMRSIDAKFGKLYNFRFASQALPDEAIRKRLLAIESHFAIPFGSKGDPNRHIGQGDNYAPRNSKKPTRPTMNFRVKGVNSSFYDTADKQMMRVGYISQAQSDTAMRQAVKQARTAYIRQSLADWRKYNVGASKQEINNARNRFKREAIKMFADGNLIGLHDDMSLMGEDASQSLTTRDYKSGVFSQEVIDKLNVKWDKARKHFDKITDKTKRGDAVARWILNTAFGKKSWDLDTASIVGEHSQTMLSKLGEGFRSKDFSSLLGATIESEYLREMGSQGKTGSSYMGERSWTAVIKQQIWKQYLKNLTKDTGVDFSQVEMIRLADEIKQNKVSRLVRALISTAHSENKASDVLSKMPKDIAGLFTINGQNIEIDEAKFEKLMDDGVKFKVNGKSVGIYEAILEAFVKADLYLEKDKDGGYIPKNGVLLINDVINQLSLDKWYGKATGGRKERADIQHILEATKRGAKGNEDRMQQLEALQKELETLYDPSKGANAKYYNKAKKLAEAVDKALKQTVDSSRKDVSALIGSSYHASTTGRSQNASISIGYGSQYSIDLSDPQLLAAEGAVMAGKIAKEDYERLVWGRINQMKQQIVANNGTNIAADQIGVFLDPGSRFGFKSEYGDEAIEGQVFYLPNTGLDELDTRGDYTISPFYSAFMKLMYDVAENKGADVFSRDAKDAFGGMFYSHRHKEGALYEVLNKAELANSAWFETRAMSTDEIDKLLASDNPDDKRRGIEMATSAYTSASGLRRLLSDTSEFIDENGNFDKKAYYKKLTGKDLTGKALTDDNAFEQLKNKAIADLIEKARTEGLEGLIERYPNVENEALKFAKLYVSDDIHDSETIQIGPALAKLAKADFDGDKIAAMALLLSEDAKGGYQQTRERFQDVAMKVYSMSKKASGTPSEKRLHVGLDAIRRADDGKLMQLASDMAKVNKKFTGSISLMSSRTRSFMSQNGFGSGASDIDKMVQGYMVEGVMEAFEQDSIDVKKIFAKIKAENPNLSNRGVKQKAAKFFTEVQDVMDKLGTGEVTFNEFLNSMGELGVLETTDINGKKVTRLNHDWGRFAVARMLADGADAETLKRYGIDAATGIMSLEGLQRAGTAVDEAAISRHGVRLFGGSTKGRDMRGLALINTYSPENRDSAYHIMKELGITDVAPSGQQYDVAGHIVKQSAASMAATLGELTEVLKDFVQNFETIGRGMVSQARDFGFLNTDREMRTTSYLSAIMPSKYVSTSANRTYEERYNSLTDAQKQKFAKAETDQARADILGMPLSSYKAAKGLLFNVGEGTYAHAVIESMAMSEAEAAKHVAEAEAAYTQGLTFAGVSAEQQKAIMESAKRRAVRINENRIHKGERLVGNEIKFDKKVFGDAFTSPFGTSLEGKVDFMTYTGRGKGGVIIVGDQKFYKNGMPTAENIAQNYIYQGLVKQTAAALKGGQISEEVAARRLGLDLHNTSAASMLRYMKERGALINVQGRLATIDEFGAYREFLQNGKFTDEQYKELYGQRELSGGMLRALINSFSEDTRYALAGSPEYASEALKWRKEHSDKENKKDDTESVETETQAENAYIAALKQELQVRLQLEDVKRKQNLTTNRQELDTLKQQQDALEQELRVRQKITRSRKKDAKQFGPLSKDAKEKELLAGLSYESRLAGVMTRKQGARSIFDILGNGVKRAFQNFFNFNIVYRAVRSISTSFEKVIGLTKELDAVLTNLRIVSGENADGAYDMMIKYNELAQTLGATTKEVAESANIWLRQGYSIQETQQLITSSTYLSKLGMISQADATRDLTAVLKGFKMEAAESMSVVDKLTELDKNYAASAGEIGEALSRVSAVAQQAGMSLDETAAAVTVIMDVTQQGAQMSGTALRTMLSRFSQVKAGSFASMIADEEDVENINDIEKVLNALGISLRKGSMEMRDWSDVLSELNDKWVALSDVEKNAIATAFGGTRQRNSFLVLMNNYDRVQEATQKAADSAGTAEDKYQAYTDSVEYSLKKIEQSWERFTIKLRSNEAMKAWGDAISFVIDKLSVALRLVANFRAQSFVVSRMQGKQFTGFGRSLGNLIRPSSSMQEAAALSMAGHEKNWGARAYKTLGKIPGIGRLFGGKGQESTASAQGTTSQFNIPAGMQLNTAGGYGIDAKGRLTYTDGSTTMFQNPTNGKWYKMVASKNGKMMPRQVAGSQVPKGDALVQKQGFKGKLQRFGAAYKQNIAMGAAVGATAGLTSFLSEGGMADDWKIFNVGDVKDTVADKSVRAGANMVATGMLTAIPGIGPILGPALGPVIGDVVGAGVKKLLHADELTRKAIIEQAEKEIKAIGEASSALTEMVSLAKTDSKFWSADDWKAWNENLEKLLKLYYDDEGGARFNQYFTELTEGKDAAEALRDLTNNAGLAAQELVNAANAAAALANAEAQKDQETEELYQLEVEASKARAQAKKTGTAEDVKAAERAEQKYQARVMAQQKALTESQLEAAFYTSGVGSMTAEQIGNSTLEGVAYKIAKDWSERYGGAFTDGQLSSAALQQITNFLRGQGGYEELFNNTTRSFRQIQRAAEGWTEKDQQRALAYNSDGLTDAERNAILAANPEQLERIARGFGMTVESFEKLEDILDIITIADANSTLEQFTDKIKGLVEVFTGFASGNVTQSVVDKLKSTAPELLLGSSGQFDVEGAGGRLMQAIVSGDMDKAIGGKAWENALTDADTWTAFKVWAERNDFDLRGAAGEAYKSFADAQQAGQIFPELQEAFTEAVKETTVASQEYNQFYEYGLKLSKHYIQQQIDGLQSIKDSMGEINRLREKEIALIKARDALENAKNEKKRVYREGLGFVYTADSEAIATAQENLEKLETEKRQEDVQYQIDVLKQQQEILDNIKENEDLKALKKTFDDAFDQNGTFGLLYTFLSEKLNPKAHTEGIGNAIGEVAGETNILQANEFKQKREDAAAAVEQYESTVDKYNQETDVGQKWALYEAANTAKQLMEEKDKAMRDDPLFGTWSNTARESYGLSNKVLRAPGEDVKFYQIPTTNANGAGRAIFTLPYNNTPKDKESFNNEVLHGKSYRVYSKEQQRWIQNGYDSADGRFFNDDANITDGNIVYANGGLWLISGGKFYPIDMVKNTKGELTKDVTFGFHGWKSKKKTGLFDNAQGIIPQYSLGTMSTSGGYSLVNEFGTEGIVTPYGTLTALPAKSGVVPADLTKNLFELGAVAPTLVRRMEQRDILERTNNNTEDNSMSIQNFYAKFETGEGFDFEKLLMQARQYVAISKQNRNR